MGEKSRFFNQYTPWVAPAKSITKSGHEPKNYATGVDKSEMVHRYQLFQMSTLG